MKINSFDDFLVQSNFVGDSSFFDEYLNGTTWVDANILYGERIPAITNNLPMVDQYIKNIERYDFKLKKFVLWIFNFFGIKSRDFRCDFFLVKKGGYMPPHIDSQSKIAILLPLTKNTGSLVCEHMGIRKEYLYQTLVLLNTQVQHEVLPPTEDRLLFRIGVHDFDFDKVLLSGKEGVRESC